MVGINWKQLEKIELADLAQILDNLGFIHSDCIP